MRPALQAMDDDEGHTINDELRMMGLEGDDEDGMEEEREELFGRRGNLTLELELNELGCTLFSYLGFSHEV